MLPILSVVSVELQNTERHTYLLGNFLVTPSNDGFDIEYSSKGEMYKLTDIKTFTVKLFSDCKAQ